jgi:hypothetical protein
VRQRQEEIDQLIVAQRSLLEGHVLHVPVVAVREQAALGRARGAGGVDVEADVVAPDRLHPLLVLRVVAAAAALAQLVQGDGVADVPLRVEDDHELEVREVVPDLADLGELLLVFDEDRPRLRVVRDVVDLLGRVRLIDRDRAGARRQDPEVGVGPLRPGVGEDGDLVALLDPEVDQAEGDLLDGLAELLVGDVHPLIARLVLQSGLAGVLLGRQRDDVGDGP